MLDSVDRGLLKSQAFLNGQFVGTGETPVFDPATGEKISSVPNFGAAEASAAVEAAAAAFRPWAGLTAKERGKTLRQWYDLIVASRANLAAILTGEQGKPFEEALGEIDYAASYVEFYAEEAKRVSGEILSSHRADARLLVLRQPIGVVAAITPWNFPLAMIARKIAPALAVGCTVVAKPAEDTPLTALALAALAVEAGVTPGVLNVITASRTRGIDAVADWLADDRVRKMTFTGSTAVGIHLARESAGTLKKLSLELGGNAPFVVFDDADLESAVAGLMASKFRNGGQTCVCPNRVYVQAGVYERFASMLAKRVEALHVAPASDANAQIGPMINPRAVEKIGRHVEDALSHGARALTGGATLPLLGPNYFAPTVLVDVNDSMLVSQEETFGPVVPLFRFETEDEAIHRANDTPYGLAAYFYTQDMRRAQRVARRLEAGVIGMNEGAVSSEAAPFGGVKASGYGREGSKYGLDDYMSIKYVCQGGLD